MDAKAAIFNYCNYQERSHKEVRNKLYDLGCRTFEVDRYISELIEAGLLNEERYARALARGKFRLKQWGRNKIVSHLKSQDVSEYCIKKALAEIDPDAYYQTLQKLAVKKWMELKQERNQFAKRAKVFRYLLQKGYESGLINEVCKEIIEEGLPGEG